MTIYVADDGKSNPMLAKLDFLMAEFHRFQTTLPTANTAAARILQKRGLERVDDDGNSLADDPDAGVFGLVRPFGLDRFLTERKIADTTVRNRFVAAAYAEADASQTLLIDEAFAAFRQISGFVREYLNYVADNSNGKLRIGSFRRQDAAAAPTAAELPLFDEWVASVSMDRATADGVRKHLHEMLAHDPQYGRDRHPETRPTHTPTELDKNLGKEGR
jgi:hypothetical protein